MLDFIMNFINAHMSFNSVFTLLLYYIPLAANLVIYSFRVGHRIQKDKAALADNTKYYSEWLRIRHVVGYLALSVLPAVNLLAFAFDTLGSVWAWLVKRFARFFNFRFVGSDKKA